MSAQPGWDRILDEGEEILWQGRPDGALVLRPERTLLFIFGLGFAGFALFWMVIASRSGGMIWAFGLVHFFTGAALAIGPNIWGAYRRRHSWYTLTNRRAFIATDMQLLGRKLKSYPIQDNALLKFNEGNPPSIKFASETRRAKNGTYQVAIGFDRIHEARDVYEMIRGIQKGKA